MAASPSAADEVQDNWGPSDDAAMGSRRSAEPSNDPLPVDDRGQDPIDTVDYPRGSSVGTGSVHKGDNYREKQVKVLIRSFLAIACSCREKKKKSPVALAYGNVSARAICDAQCLTCLLLRGFTFGSGP